MRLPRAIAGAMGRLPIGAWLARLEAARQPAASRPAPLVLLRVDDYPHWGVPTQQFRRFQQLMSAVGASFLVAATPFLAADPLSPISDARPEDATEWEWLAKKVDREEVEVGLHGATHRTRRFGFHSEFDDMPPDEARVVIAQAWRFLACAGCRPIAFVPPFNRFPPALWQALPDECRILCLGPESLLDVPPKPAVGTRGGRTVVFSLPPFYGRAAHILGALERGDLLDRPGVVLPITLHWTWELDDDFAAVRRLAERIAGRVGTWRSLVRSMAPDHSYAESYARPVATGLIRPIAQPYHAKPRRLVVFSRVTEGHGAGGMQRHLTWLVRWLRATGADVTVVTTRGGTLPADAGVRTIEIPGTRPGRYTRAWWRGTSRLVSEPAVRECDLVLSEDGGAWGAIDRLRRLGHRPPIVMFRHGTTLLNLRQTFPPRRLRAVGSMALSLRDWLRHPRRLGRYVDLMVCVSEPVAVSALSESAGPDTEIRVVSLGVELDAFRPATDPGPVRAALGLSPELPTLLWVGRDVPGKRVAVALEVFDRLQGRGVACQLALAVASPRGPTLAAVEGLRRRYGSRVQLFPNADVSRIRSLEQASVLLFPSVLPEAVPIVILEALASGVPVLATPAGSLPELAVFRARPDWLVTPDRLDAWSDRAEAMMGGAGAESARREARAIAEKCYDLAVTERCTVEAIDQLADRWARAHSSAWGRAPLSSSS
jgi:glycosyltransferase involved in cell wall biosynthesis